MTSTREFRGSALLLSLTALGLLFLAACSGGGFDDDDDDDGVADLEINIGTVTQVTNGSGVTVLCIPFDVTGVDSQTFNLLFRYFFDEGDEDELDGEPLFEATQITSAQGMSFTPPLQVTNITQFPNGTSSVSGVFYWNAGSDLGFVPTEVCFVVTASGLLADQDVDPGLVCDVMFSAGVPPTTSNGDNVGPADPGVMGLARHTAHNVASASGDRVVISGGETQQNLSGLFIPVDDVRAFAFDPDAGTHTIGFMGMGQAPRTWLASSAFFASNGTTNVLVTGGNDGSNDLASTEIYTSSPEALMAGPAMGTARARHASCWLPNNCVLVVGGASMAAASSAELYNPTTNTWSMVAAPLSPRADHTCTLLPNGRVLVVGGRNPTAPTTPLVSEIYDPVANTWTATGPAVDRYQHTASLLVNGAVMFIGGRTVTGDATLQDAIAYRTFPGFLNGSATPTFPAGFSTVTDAMIQERTEHATNRLGSGELLVTGGFGFPAVAGGGGKSALASAEVFLPAAFTAATLGAFSSTNIALNTARARHTATTMNDGAVAIVAGVTGDEGAPTALDSIETYDFNNAKPVVTNITAQLGNLMNVPISFVLSDADNDRSFVFVQYSTNGGTSYEFATLTNYADTVNLAPGTRTVAWNAAADGLTAGMTAIVRIIPAGGVFGTPGSTTISF